LAFATFLVDGYGLAFAALALVVFGAYDSYPCEEADSLLNSSHNSISLENRPQQRNSILCNQALKGQKLIIILL